MRHETFSFAPRRKVGGEESIEGVVLLREAQRPPLISLHSALRY